MRTLITLLLLALTPCCWSQQYQYVPMPTSNARWLFGHLSSTCSTYQWMLNGDDTVINGFTYKKILQRGYSLHHDSAMKSNEFSGISTYPDFFAAALREDNKKIYVIDLKRSPSETLLIDFSLKAGDTFNAFYHVAYEDTVIVNNTPRRRLTLKDNTFGTATFTYTEGYGPINVLFGLHNDVLIHHCFQTDAGYYPSNEPCSYIWPYGTPTSVESATTSPITVFPVPFSNNLTISTKKRGTVTIFNMLGAAVVLQHTDGRTELSTSHLLPGTYFLKLTDANGAPIHTQKLVKE